MKELVNIQTSLNAPKGQFNKFGNYHYRSCEDILGALKPLLQANKTSINLTDDITEVAGRVYVKATATLTNESGEKVASTAFAREADTKKGMDAAQITGSASSYARKYALNGLLAIDDTQDADSMDNRNSGTSNNNHQGVSDHIRKYNALIATMKSKFNVSDDTLVKKINEKLHLSLAKLTDFANLKPNVQQQVNSLIEGWLKS